MRGAQLPLPEAERALYQGDLQRARSLAGSQVKAHPRAAKPRILLARVEMGLGNLESAHLQLREALRLDPDNIDALHYLAKLSVMLSQVAYRQLFTLAPDSARVHQLMAESYLAQQDTAKAEQEFEAALKASPNLVAVLNGLADLRRSQGRYEEASAGYARAQEIEPRDYDSAYGLGVCSLRLSNLRPAIPYFRKALELKPDSAAGRLALGEALLKAGDPAAAVAELRVAVRREPNMRQGYTLLGAALQKLGRPEEAREAFNKMRELSQLDMEASEKRFSLDELIPSVSPGADK